jgi:hypothetical protein
MISDVVADDIIDERVVVLMLLVITRLTGSFATSCENSTSGCLPVVYYVAIINC